MSNNENMNSSLEETLGRLFTMVQSIDARLGNLEAKVDSRLYDTRPNFKAIQSQLAEVIDSQLRFREETREQIQGLREETREQIQGVRNDLSSLRAETEKGFRTIDRRMERQIGEFERLHAYQRDLEDRVDKLEKLSSS
jgi:chromosome segregation ATPase